MILYSVSLWYWGVIDCYQTRNFWWLHHWCSSISTIIAGSLRTSISNFCYTWCSFAISCFLHRRPMQLFLLPIEITACENTAKSNFSLIQIYVFYDLNDSPGCNVKCCSPDPSPDLLTNFPWTFKSGKRTHKLSYTSTRVCRRKFCYHCSWMC